MYKPAFQNWTYVDSAGTFTAEISLPPLTAGHLILEKENGDDSGSVKQQVSCTVSVTDSALVSSSKMGSTLDGGSRKRSRRSTQNEVTIEAKLTTDSNGVVPRTGSLQTVLTQALHTNDSSLLEFCLSEGKTDAVVHRTIQRLPPKYILPLLIAIVNKYRSRPSRGPLLLTWVKQLINTHSSYLMTVPELGQSLSVLYQTLNSRLANFKKLLHLNGRLELVLSQASHRSTAQAASQTALTTFDYVSENDDDEEEDANADKFDEEIGGDGGDDADADGVQGGDDDEEGFNDDDDDDEEEEESD